MQKVQQENEHLRGLVGTMQLQLTQLLAQQQQESENSENKKIKQFMKLKPQKFNGSSKKDPEDWCYELKSALKVVDITEPATEILAVQFALEDKAAAWWRSITDDDEVTTPSSFEEFKAALIKRYRPQDPMYSARDKLKALRQTGSTRTYVDKFEQLAHDGKLKEPEKFAPFIEGLKPSVKKYIDRKYRRGKFDQFQEMIEAAIADDEAEWNASEKNKNNDHPWRGRSGGQQRGGSSQNPSSTNPGATPMDIGSFTPIPKLTDELRAQCRKEGRCLFCRDKGHMVADCPKLKEQQSKPNPNLKGQ